MMNQSTSADTDKSVRHTNQSENMLAHHAADNKVDLDMKAHELLNDLYEKFGRTNARTILHKSCILSSTTTDTGGSSSISNRKRSNDTPQEEQDSQPKPMKRKKVDRRLEAAKIISPDSWLLKVVSIMIQVGNRQRKMLFLPQQQKMQMIYVPYYMLLLEAIPNEL